ncbi:MULTISPECIES: MFS transporter [Hyphobacterium]|uniref:MFS transporter n=1 Tax=Hyphobacterium vulgare TaxID=1736751 RepID=A0ABV7A0A7_9PROT
MSSPAPAAAFSRYALHYSVFYLAFGAVLPYLPVLLEERGLSPEAIGVAIAGGMIGRSILSPLGAGILDRSDHKKRLLTIFAFAALAAFVLLFPGWPAVLTIVIAALGSALNGAQIPLLDAVTIRAAMRSGFGFGPARAFGSGAFVVANIGAGALVARFGGEAALIWIVAGSTMAILSLQVLPAVTMRSHQPSSGLKWNVGELLTPGFVFATLAVALVQGAHGFQYSFSTLAWRAEGIPTSVVGLLWGWAVIAEIVFLFVNGRVFRNWSPAALIAAGAAVSVIRWLVFAMSPPVWVLFLFQTTHAFTFTATYIGFIRYCAERVPDRYAASAQAINSALSGGVILAGATVVSGLLYERYGAGGYAAMAVPAALGGLFAALLWRNLNSQTAVESTKTVGGGDAE